MSEAPPLTMRSELTTWVSAGKLRVPLVTGMVTPLIDARLASSTVAPLLAWRMDR